MYKKSLPPDDFLYNNPIILHLTVLVQTFSLYGCYLFPSSEDYGQSNIGNNVKLQSRLDEMLICQKT